MTRRSSWLEPTSENVFLPFRNEWIISAFLVVVLFGFYSA
jgi:hypothetical protein